MLIISGITNVGKDFLKALDASFLLDHILHQSSTGRTCSTTKNIRRVISAHNAKVAAVMGSQLWPAPPPTTDQASVLPIWSSSADTALVTPQRWGQGRQPDRRAGGRGDFRYIK